MNPPAAPPPFPGPRTAAGWWAALAPLAPAAVAAGYFPVLRAELLVETTGRRPLDPLARAVLAALPLADPPTAAGLDRMLHVGPPRAAAALDDARQLGLVEGWPGGRSDPSLFRLLDRGRDALAHGLPTPQWDRRRFAFRAGHFVPLPDPGPLTPAAGPPSAGPRAGLAFARAAADHPDEWKREAGFPTGPARLVASAADLPERVRWRAVPVERDEVLTAVVVAAGDTVRGYGTGPPDWPLAPGPLFTMSGDPARGAFPELFADPPEADLRAAWQGWARSRTVPADELAECRVAADGVRLAVGVPARLGDWLRANRADVFAGDTWVWVGDGPVRRPAVLVL